MKTVFIPIILAIFLQSFGAPSNYGIKRYSAWTPSIDGSLNEWPETAFIDSIRNDANVFARTSTTPWNRNEIQMKLYATYDSLWVYFAVKVIADTLILPDSSGSVTTGDNLKVNPSGQNRSFYISAGGAIVLKSSCDYVLHSTLKARVTRSAATNYLPWYEFSISRSNLDPFNTKRFILSIGSEETDNRIGTNLCYLAFGVEYTGNKQDWYSNPWDNPTYYPTFNLLPDTVISDTTGIPHIYWYGAARNNYPLFVSNLGPSITSPAVLHEGKITTGTIRGSAGSADHGFGIGNGLDGVQARSSFIWIRDLCHSTGSVTVAKLRGEFCDGWTGNALCNAGTIVLKVGVVDYSGNIAYYGGESKVPENAVWMDAINPLGIYMGYDYSGSPLMASKNVTIYAPTGRVSGSTDVILDGRFFEIDVTDQVNWILSHTGTNKGTYSGQYAIVFLSQAGDGTFGKLHLYADESQSGNLSTTSPWTTDGNSMHLLFRSKNLTLDTSTTHCIYRAYPQSFATATLFAKKRALQDTGAIFFTLDSVYMQQPKHLPLLTCAISGKDSAISMKDSLRLAFHLKQAAIQPLAIDTLRLSRWNGSVWSKINPFMIHPTKRIAFANIVSTGTYCLHSDTSGRTATEQLPLNKSPLKPFMVRSINGGFDIQFSLNCASKCRIDIYNTKGQLIKTV